MMIIRSICEKICRGSEAAPLGIPLHPGRKAMTKKKKAICKIDESTYDGASAVRLTEFEGSNIACR